MTHLDSDTLALVALAELDLSPTETEHLAACRACAGELDALRRTVLIGRTAASVDLVHPADAVWGRIHAALGLSETVAEPPRLADAAADTAYTADTEPPRLAQPAAEPARGSVAAPLPVVDLGARRRRAWLPVAAAACAAGLVGGIAGGAWWQSTRAPAPETVIAQAQLDALPGWTASGAASVQESADGGRDVVVDLEGDSGSSALREVWLLTADASGLVSVGLLDGSSGRFSIPAGIDLAEYPVVDVSAEPADGNPAHSGDSIVRGTLQNS